MQRATGQGKKFSEVVPLSLSDVEANLTCSASCNRVRNDRPQLRLVGCVVESFEDGRELLNTTPIV